MMGSDETQRIDALIHRRAVLQEWGVMLYAPRSSMVKQITPKKLFNRDGTQVKELLHESIVPKEVVSDKFDVGLKPTNRSEIVRNSISSTISRAQKSQVPIIAQIESQLIDSVIATNVVQSSPAVLPSVMEESTSIAMPLLVERFVLNVICFRTVMLMSLEVSYANQDVQDMWQNLAKAVQGKSDVFQWPVLEHIDWQRANIVQSALNGFFSKYSHINTIYYFGSLPSYFQLDRFELVAVESVAKIQTTPQLKKQLWEQLKQYLS